MAAIRKRTWTTPAGEQKAAWLVDYRDSAGKRRAKQFTRKRDAEAWSTQAAWEVSKGVHTADSQSITVAQAADIWIRAAESKDRERSTIKQYREWVELHIKPLIGDKKLSQLSMPSVETFKDALLETRSPAMAGKVVRGLRRTDVDLKRGEIHIAQRADQWGTIGSPKSEAGTRTIPIPPVLVTELRKWMLRAPHSDLGLLFPNSEGGVRLHSNLLNREYWPLQVRAGLVRSVAAKGADEQPSSRAKYDFHALRHYAASAWIKQRVDLKRLTTWLGHSSVQITLDTYGHLIRDDLGDAAIAAATANELLA